MVVSGTYSFTEAPPERVSARTRSVSFLVPKG